MVSENLDGLNADLSKVMITCNFILQTKTFDVFVFESYFLNLAYCPYVCLSNA